MDRNYLYQVDIREWIENGLDAEIMVPVFGNRVDKKYDVYLQSFLLPIDAVESDMQNDTYNANTMEPGITVYGSWENDEKVYHRWGNDDDFEPLIIKRNFNGVATDSVEVAEEFRLLFNLYFNSQKNEYVDVSDGEGITVVKMNDNYISNYYGINVADLDQYVFAQSEDPKSAETIVIFKCDDKDKRAEYMTAVENAMNQKYDELSNYNLPEEAKLVKDSKVYSEGSIVYLVISDNAKDMNSIIKDSIS